MPSARRTAKPAETKSRNGGKWVLIGLIVFLVGGTVGGFYAGKRLYYGQGCPACPTLTPALGFEVISEQKTDTTYSIKFTCASNDAIGVFGACPDSADICHKVCNAKLFSAAGSNNTTVRQTVTSSAGNGTTVNEYSCDCKVN
ncbi:MAG: hypothetical protein FWC61_00695 [Proteobacteria bacterium]|nr:hypothetical protein [Pseudomonadota bacterium]